MSDVFDGKSTEVFTIPYMTLQFRLVVTDAVARVLVSERPRTRPALDDVLPQLTAAMAENLFVYNGVVVRKLEVYELGAMPLPKEPIFIKYQSTNGHLHVYVFAAGLLDIIGQLRRKIMEVDVKFVESASPAASLQIAAEGNEAQLTSLYQTIDAIGDPDGNNNDNGCGQTPPATLSQDDKEKMHALFVLTNHAVKHAVEFALCKRTDYIAHSSGLFADGYKPYSPFISDHYKAIIR